MPWQDLLPRSLPDGRGSVGANRREFLRAAVAAPVVAGLAALTRPSPLDAAPQMAEATGGFHRAPYEALTQFILPGHDEFAGEQTAMEIGRALRESLTSGTLPLSATAKGSSPAASSHRSVADDLAESIFDVNDHDIASGWRRWIASLGEIRRAQFSVLPQNLIRFEAAGRANGKLYHRVGHWRQVWVDGRITGFTPLDEQIAASAEPWFRDVTGGVFSGCRSFEHQLARGIPYWRSRLDPACGIDIYGNNGVSAGDIDGDGVDEVYVCQPGGLPNRLYKFQPNGALRDITEEWRVGIEDDSSCALFIDLRNSGKQDLVVLRAAGPLLLLNRDDHFELRTDAFDFANPPAGGFTGMAAADYDRDGKLDLYLCTYVYFQSEAQYTYASPYHDAQNGPPNFLFRNRLNADGTGRFEDVTASTGMNENNNRFSFAPAWCDYNGDGWPDLYVANDFGRKNLYRNHEGQFRDVAADAGVEDIGPGMSASWFDYDGDGRPDLYVANMWSDVGQRVIHDAAFKPAQGVNEAAYQRHTKGNSLFKNSGDGTFIETTASEHADFGRWAWASGGHDFNNDGQPEILVTCGMLTNASDEDLMGFFWRQVVARSPTTAKPSAAYEGGWNAINQFAREEYSWSGHETNVVHARRGNRFYDFSGVSGLDFAEDGRAFAVTDFDGDGRPDVFLKSRLGPQVRVLQNNCAEGRHSIGFRLVGSTSNRDAIGARVEVDGQVKWLEAGSGYLSQHTKTLLFGLGTRETVRRVQILWPSGARSELANLSAGAVHTVHEDKPGSVAAPMRPHRPLTVSAVEVDNSLALEDTVFVEPIPLPEQLSGPSLLIVTSGESVPDLKVATHVIKLGDGDTDRRRQWTIFRRYLFDWRAPLQTPFCLLLNGAGQAVKVYSRLPSVKTAGEDVGCQAQACVQVSASVDSIQSGIRIRPWKRDFYKLGAAFLLSGYADQALPYLEETLRRTPDNPRVLLLVGQIHARGGRPDQAEGPLRRALELNPSLAEAHTELGTVAESHNNWNEALAEYDRALALKPDLVDALVSAAAVCDKLNDGSRGESYLKRALAIDPNSAEAENAMGLVEAKRDRPEEAREHFQKAIALRRDYAAAINNLGVLYTKTGKPDDAVAALQYGIRVAPDEDILYLNLARLYVQRGQMDRARALMQSLLDRKPSSETAQNALRELERRN